MQLGASGPVECTASGCTVGSNDPFSIRILADPAPTFDMSGFGAEVLFTGLVWQMRECQQQLQIDRADGENAAICEHEPGPMGQARIAVISEVDAPPLTPFEDISNGDAIFDLAVRCPEPGTFEVFLTAVTNQENSAPFGAIYFRNDATEFPVRTQGSEQLNLDGEGNRNVAVADTLSITCEGPGGIGRQSPIPEGTAGPPTPGGDGETPPSGPSATGGSTTGTAEASPTGGTISPEDATATALAAEDGGEDGDDGDDDDSIWLWVIVGVAVAGTAGGLGFLAWRRYQGGAGPGDGDAPPPADAAT
jgi:hypothetical protein